MIIRNSARRRAASITARFGFALSLAGFCVSLLAFFAVSPAPVGAAAAGSAEIIEPLTNEDGTPNPDGGDPLTSGDSTTKFSLALPAGATCPGDSELDGWRVTSYLVSASIEPSSLVFDSVNGPTPTQYGSPQSSFRQPLHDITASPYITAQTAKEDPEGSGGPIINIPTFSLGVYAPSDALPAGALPPGTYNLGIACVKPSGETFPIDRYWNAKITLVAGTGAGGWPLTWTAQQSAAGEDTEIELTADPSSKAEEGETVTLTATVTPDDAEGTVTFKDGDDELDEVELDDGEAELAVDDLEVGAHTFTAEFVPADGSGFDGAESAELEYDIVEAGEGGSGEATTVTLVASPADRADVGEKVTFTATVSPAEAEGTITFQDGGTDLGTPLAVGGDDPDTVTYETSELTEGTHSLTAVFTPTDADSFAASTSSSLSYVVGDASAGGAVAGGAPSGGATGAAGSGDVTAAAGPTSSAPLGPLAFTGSSLSITVWGVLFLVFGRMVLLLGRSPAVLPARPG